MTMNIDLGLPGIRAHTRVVVAMSGGVDSSVVAAMLAESGYDVVGITLQLYDHGAATKRVGACCAGQDINDARLVAERLNIPHYVLDYETRFRTEVIDRFSDSYLRGETPIPCVDCNQRIKFAELLDTARDLGASALATGHYVDDRALDTGRRGLFRAVDADRDQSYFLYGTTREQLEMLRFPLGQYSKQATRDLAHRYGLSVAEKPDSQDICFVPAGRYVDVIKRLRPDAQEPGAIVHMDGRHLGEHSGIIHFTVGQRRGLGIASGEALYVISIDPATRRVIVGPKEALATRTIHLRDINWLGDGDLKRNAHEERNLAVRIRSSRPPRPAVMHLLNDEIVVTFADDEEGVSPGQACVFYENEGSRARMIGGGVITRTQASPTAAKGIPASQCLSIQ